MWLSGQAMQVQKFANLVHADVNATFKLQLCPIPLANPPSAH
jgi:hypothetical protein